jgi:hypothetical protein
MSSSRFVTTICGSTPNSAANAWNVRKRGRQMNGFAVDDESRAQACVRLRRHGALYAKPETPSQTRSTYRVVKPNLLV